MIVETDCPVLQFSSNFYFQGFTIGENQKEFGELILVCEKLDKIW